MKETGRWLYYQLASVKDTFHSAPVFLYAGLKTIFSSIVTYFGRAYVDRKNTVQPIDPIMKERMCSRKLRLPTLAPPGGKWVRPIFYWALHGSIVCSEEKIFERAKTHFEKACAGELFFSRKIFQVQRTVKGSL